MAWVTPSNKSTGTVVAAADWNQDVVANPIALRLGGIAMTAQVNGRFVVASSSTQLSVAKNAYVKLFTEVFGG